MKRSYLSIGDYCREYMRYLGIAKTARRSYAESERLLKARGFRELGSFKSIKPGDKVYRGYEDRTIMAAVVGKRKISAAGLKVVGGHTDAPRTDSCPSVIIGTIGRSSSPFHHLRYVSRSRCQSS